jgi:hypothetical protein
LGSGYVTDTAYVHDFRRVQTPTILSLAALSKAIDYPSLNVGVVTGPAFSNASASLWKSPPRPLRAASASFKSLLN